ncbi:hypothetical protein Trydic_g9902 [Trypoxylus dichotomus]
MEHRETCETDTLSPQTRYEDPFCEKPNKWAWISLNETRKYDSFDVGWLIDRWNNIAYLINAKAETGNSVPQLNEQINCNEKWIFCLILPGFQFGFRQEHSTTHQLLRITEHITEHLDKSTPTAAVMLDIEKAFDKVWHEGLIYKLRQKRSYFKKDATCQVRGK